MTKTYEEINQKIQAGDAVVLTAEEMISMVEEHGAKYAAQEVDVVTTGTFGAMCSSGAFLNFGHSDPPIKPEHVWLNDVHAYHGNAAADVYIGATRMASPRNYEYGGGHVIEDLIKGKSIHYKATAYGTDCYPRTHLETEFTLEDLNQAILLNPRNAYQHYNCAVNTSDKTIYTYMGKLLPNLGNATYSGAGELAPLMNDPQFQTIGVGTKIFLAGGEGIIINEGTQHSPKSLFGTLMVMGDMKTMNPEYIAGASFKGYGTSMFNGIGIPIPILNEEIAQKCAIKDEDIMTSVVDYSVGRLDRPTLKEVSYKELKEGRIEVNGTEIRVSSMSSLYKARKIANELKSWIRKGKFTLNKPVRQLSTSTGFHPIKETQKIRFVKEFMKPAIIVTGDTNLQEVAAKVLKYNESHVVVVQDNGELCGFLTTFDLAKAVAGKGKSVYDIMIKAKNVHRVKETDPTDFAIRLMKKYSISSLPVVGKDNKVVGIISAEELINEEGGVK